MKKTTKTVIRSMMCVALLLMVFVSSAIVSHAEYSSAAAATYAYNRALSYSPDFYDFTGSDCTNFVSQCIFVGGIKMVGKDTTVSAPGPLTETKQDTTEGNWYMKKVERTLACDYWQYSSSWSLVNYFRSYHASQSGASAKYYNVTTKWNAANVIKTLKRGDIVQYEWDGNRIV